MKYIDGSLIFSPTGDILTEAKTQVHEVITAEIDLELVARLRDRWKSDLNRREDAYFQPQPKLATV